MKKGFSIIELIISLSLVSVISLFVLIIVRNASTTYADPYENVRLIISDAIKVYLNTDGIEEKNRLNNSGSIVINTNSLIETGLLEENCYVKNTKENKNLQNIDVIVTIDADGFIQIEANL